MSNYTFDGNLIESGTITLDQIKAQYIGTGSDLQHLLNRVIDLERQNLLLTNKMVELEKEIASLMQDRLGIDSE